MATIGGLLHSLANLWAIELGNVHANSTQNRLSQSEWEFDANAAPVAVDDKVIDNSDVRRRTVRCTYEADVSGLPGIEEAEGSHVKAFMKRCRDTNALFSSAGAGGLAFDSWIKRVVDKSVAATVRFPCGGMAFLVGQATTILGQSFKGAGGAINGLNEIIVIPLCQMIDKEQPLSSSGAIVMAHTVGHIGPQPSRASWKCWYCLELLALPDQSEQDALDAAKSVVQEAFSVPDFATAMYCDVMNTVMEEQALRAAVLPTMVEICSIAIPQVCNYLSAEQLLQLSCCSSLTRRVVHQFLATARHLDFRGGQTYFTAHGMGSLLRRCVSLESVKIQAVNCHLTASGLGQQLAFFPNLYSIEIAQCTDIDESTLCSVFETARLIRNLSLTGCRNFGARAAKAVAENCTMLKRIRIHGSGTLMQHSEVSAIKSRLAGVRTLELQCFQDCRPNCFDSLAIAMGCMGAEILCIQHCSPLAPQTIESILGAAREVKELDLTGCGIDDKCMAKFPRMPHVSKLNLTLNPLSRRGLLLAITNCRNVDHLVLNQLIGINDTVLLEIADQVPFVSKISALGCRGITPEGVRIVQQLRHGLLVDTSANSSELQDVDSRLAAMELILGL